MLSAEQRRELMALGLLGLAAFLALSLVPLGLLGVRTAAWFPSGNLVGRVGATVQDVLLGAAGWPVVLLPLLLVLGGLLAGKWMDEGRAVRLGILGLGFLILLPPVLHALVPVEDVRGSGGWLGEALGGPMVAGLGWVGTLLVALVAAALLSVATLGWNPLPPLARLARDAARQTGRLLGRGVTVARGWYASPPVGEDLTDPEEGPPRAALATEPAASGTAGANSAPEGNGSPLDPPAAPGKGSDVRTGGTTAQLLPDPLDSREREDGTLPPMDLLSEPRDRDRKGMERELDRLGEVLTDKLRTFNVEGEVGGRTTGPVVTQFEVVPAPGVKVNRIANLDADLALAMKARTVRIVAPIPGKGAVGVEIPNPEPETVQLREILESHAYRNSGAELPLALGKDLRGDPYVADLTRMPHALIAGATGSGKSVCLNTIITSLVYRHTPKSLRLLLIDPKMVELSTYRDLPHLRHPVVTDPAEAAGVLKWAVLEMERRYALLSENGVRSIAEFNRRVSRGHALRRVEPVGVEGDPDRWIYDDGPLAYIVLVIDELADLMMNVQGEVEKPLTHLAQKARAIGIHLIVATQRPSVNVITGLIKANFPCRIAFRVASKTDSRTILDQNGADALLGNGDMLFLPPGQSTPVRVQGAFISTEDTERLVSWYRPEASAGEEADAEASASAGEVDILEVVRAREAEEAGSSAEGEPLEDRDEHFREAAEICIMNDQGSTSLLQRKLRVGYGRAARIVDQLHEAGILGPPDGSRPREVLIGMDALELLLSGQGAPDLEGGEERPGEGPGLPGGAPSRE